MNVRLEKQQAYFVGVFGVDVVFDALSTWLFDVFRRDLYQVGNSRLGKDSISDCASIQR